MANTIPTATLSVMNNFTKRPANLSQYSQMRGVTDFSDAQQFNLYEKGYQYLTIISRPYFLEKLADMDGTNTYDADGVTITNAGDVRRSLELFCYILEYEFKGISGIDGYSVDTLEYTDNINTMNTIGRVNRPSGSQISMSYTERTGSAITRFLEYYITGIKDPMTQIKTYHGLIHNGYLVGGFEHEIFNFLYIVTDNTALAIERAFLIVNCFPNSVQLDQYNAEKGAIEKVDVDITWEGFVIQGDEVNKRALRMLAHINQKNAVYNYHVALENGGYLGKGTLNRLGNLKYEKEGDAAGTGEAHTPLNPRSTDYNWQAFDGIEKTIEVGAGTRYIPVKK